MLPVGQRLFAHQTATKLLPSAILDFRDISFNIILSAFPGAYNIWLKYLNLLLRYCEKKPFSEWHVASILNFVVSLFDVECISVSGMAIFTEIQNVGWRDLRFLNKSPFIVKSRMKYTGAVNFDTTVLPALH